MSEWINPKDKLPNGTIEVLAISKSFYRCGQTLVCKYDNSDKNFKYADINDIEYIISVAYYIPLPELPKEEKLLYRICHSVKGDLISTNKECLCAVSSEFYIHNTFENLDEALEYVSSKISDDFFEKIDLLKRSYRECKKQEEQRNG